MHRQPITPPSPPPPPHHLFLLLLRAQLEDVKIPCKFFTMTEISTAKLWVSSVTWESSHTDKGSLASFNNSCKLKLNALLKLFKKLRASNLIKIILILYKQLFIPRLLPLKLQSYLINVNLLTLKLKISPFPEGQIKWNIISLPCFGRYYTWTFYSLLNYLEK